MSYIAINSSKGPLDKSGKTGIKYGLYERLKSKTGVAYMSIYISISLDICNKVGISKGDIVELSIDENDCTKGLIRGVVSGNGFKVHLRTRSWICFSVALSKFNNTDKMYDHFKDSLTKNAEYEIHADGSISIN